MSDFSKKRVSLYLKKDLVEKLDKIAISKERSRNWIVEKLLRKAAECAESDKDVICS